MPIITIPYISRILSVADIGTYSYTFSIVKYFTFFAMLGLQNYGNRSIAVVRDEKGKLNQVFSEILMMQVITTLITTVVFILFVFFYSDSYKSMFLIQGLMIFACFFDVSWVFFGLEKFKITVTRNIVIKLLTVLSILLFVKNANDLWKYTVIMSFSIFFSNLILFVALFKYVKLVRVNIKNMLSHVKPNLILFVPVLAVSIYRLFSKVMLGNISGVYELGLFENVDKIIDIPMGFITALGLVMLPHMSHLVKENNIKKMSEAMEKSFLFVTFMSVAFTFGMIGISDNFIPIFLGPKFEGAIIIMNITAPVILFKGWANVIRTQYLIPREKYSSYMISLIIGAATNIIMNIILIPFMGAKGTAVSVLVTEIVVCLIQTWYIRKEINMKKIFRHFALFIVIGILMCIIVRIISYEMGIGILTLLIQLLIGVLFYMTLGFLYYKKKVEKTYG